MQDSVEDLCCLLWHKLLRELQSHFLKSVVLLERIFLKLQIQRRKIGSGQKKSKLLQKIMKQKQFENNKEAENKTNFSFEQVEGPFLIQVGRKTVVLAQTSLTYKMSSNQVSHSQYGTYTNSP